MHPSIALELVTVAAQRSVIGADLQRLPVNRGGRSISGQAGVIKLLMTLRLNYLLPTVD
jgi:hypothetical protein